MAIELKKRGIPFEFLIGGKGSQESRLKSIIDEKDLKDVFHFLGFLDNPKDLLMSSDVFLLPSLWEGFGYVIVEASLSELPIVAFDISSNSEVINESTGFLTPRMMYQHFVIKLFICMSIQTNESLWEKQVKTM